MGDLQHLESELQKHKEAEEQLRSRLAEAEAAAQQQEEAGRQAERQLAQMVESQRRLGQELQEGVEAREDAEASRDQAQVLPPGFCPSAGSSFTDFACFLIPCFLSHACSREAYSCNKSCPS